MVFGNSYLRWGIPCEVDGLWAQSGGFVWLGRHRRRFDVHAGNVTLGSICTAMEVANEGAGRGPLRRLLAYSKSFICADIAGGDSVLACETQSREVFPRWRGPTKLFDIEETGATATFQRQTFEVARYCVRKRLDRKDVHEDEWQNTKRTGDPRMSRPPACPDMTQARGFVVGKSMDLVEIEQDAGVVGPSADLMRKHSITSPRLIPVPESPTLSIRLPPVPPKGDIRAGVGILRSRLRPLPSPCIGYRKV